MRFVAGESEAGRRLDRVLKKFFSEAPLSFVYRTIRKDVKVNGKRVSGETLLAQGDMVEIFLPDEQIETFVLKRRARASTAKKQFDVVYEDENILVCNKPFGLLTHGDEVEKKNTLANQVIAYLMEAGGYNPGMMKIFTPAPANRLDRNTTGLVLFGKTLLATQGLVTMLRGGENGSEFVSKIYLTVVKGELRAPITLKSAMIRDREQNITIVLHEKTNEGRMMVTGVKPLKTVNGFTLVEATLMTGRTHQIRAQLAAAGFPIIGDRKYGDVEVNKFVSDRYDLTTQLLHAYRIIITKGARGLEYLQGKNFIAEPPERFKGIVEGLECHKKGSRKQN